MININRFIIFLLAATSMLIFQNCGEVDFAASQENYKALGSQGNDIQVDGITGLDPLDQNLNGPDLNGPDANGPGSGGNGGENNDGVSNVVVLTPEQRQLNFPGLSTELVRVIMNNKSCSESFVGIDTNNYPSRERQTFNGLSSAFRTANVDSLRVVGVTRTLAAKNIGQADIIGIHGSVCIEAQEVLSLIGVTGIGGHTALFSPQGVRGSAENLIGVSGNDMIIVNFDVRRITGAGRSLHLHGTQVEAVTGVFGEIHLYGGAQIGNMRGLSRGVTVHP